MTRVPAAILAIALLAGCSSASPAASDGAPSESTVPSESTAASSSSGPSSSQGGSVSGYGQIRLQVDAGDFAGTWTGDIEVGGCSRNLIASANPIVPTFVQGTFSAGAAMVVGIPDFEGFLFEIYDSAAAAASGTEQFHVGLSFLDYTAGLLVEPGKGTGSGTATLDDRGTTASLRADVTFDDGSSGSVEVDCYEVGDGE